MADSKPIGLPRQWSNHVKAGVLHAISLASVVVSYARGRATGRRRLQAQLEQATTEISLLREELSIKDDRWERSHPRRRPHYLPTQRTRILQLRAARGWTFEETARVFLVDLQTLQIWMRRLDEGGERAIVQTVEPVNRYPDFVRNLVRQLKRLFPTMGNERMAQILARAGLQLGATTIRRMIRERTGPPERSRKSSVAATASLPGIQGTRGTSISRSFRPAPDSGSRGSRSPCPSTGPSAGGSLWLWITSRDLWSVSPLFGKRRRLDRSRRSWIEPSSLVLPRRDI